MRMPRSSKALMPSRALRPPFTHWRENDWNGSKKKPRVASTSRPLSMSLPTCDWMTTSKPSLGWQGPLKNATGLRLKSKSIRCSIRYAAIRASRKSLPRSHRTRRTNKRTRSRRRCRRRADPETRCTGSREQCCKESQRQIPGTGGRTEITASGEKGVDGALSRGSRSKSILFRQGLGATPTGWRGRTGRRPSLYKKILVGRVHEALQKDVRHCRLLFSTVGRKQAPNYRRRNLLFKCANLWLHENQSFLRSDLSHDRSRRLFRCGSGLFSRANYPRTAQSAGRLRG